MIIPISELGPILMISISGISPFNIGALSISDNGVGFPEGFDLSKSTGLGLKLIRVLSEQIEGKLNIISDNGTTFKLTFPETIQFARHFPNNG